LKYILTAAAVILCYGIIAAQEITPVTKKIYNDSGKLIKIDREYLMTTNEFFMPYVSTNFNISFYLATNIDTNLVKIEDKIEMLSNLYAVLGEDGIPRPTNHISIYVFSKITNYAEVIEQIFGKDVTKKIWGRPLTFLPVNGLSLLVPPGFFRLPEDFAYLFPHEFAHHFIQDVDNIPLNNTMYWLVEGHADETQFRVLDKLYPDKYTYPDNWNIALRQVLKVYNILKTFPSEETFLYFGKTDYYTYMTHYIYNLAFLAVDYVGKRYGSEKKMNLIQGMKLYPPDDNFMTNLGITYSKFYKDFQNYLLGFNRGVQAAELPSAMQSLEIMDQKKNGELSVKGLKMGIDKDKLFFDFNFIGELWSVSPNRNMRFEIQITSGDQVHHFKFDNNYGVTVSITLTNKDKNLGTYYNSLIASDYIVDKTRIYGWIDNVFGYNGKKVDKIEFEVYAYKNYSEKWVYRMECYPKPIALK
jgi:hypothetical protein